MKLADARRRKNTRYPELLGASRCRLVVLAHEAGDRWSEEACEFVDLLAHAAACSAPPLLRGSAWMGWLRRWTALVYVTAQSALAATLLTGDAGGLDGLDGPLPELHTVLDRGGEMPAWSRLA